MPKNPSSDSINNQLMTINRMYVKKTPNYTVLGHINNTKHEAGIGLWSNKINKKYVLNEMRV